MAKRYLFLAAASGLWLETAARATLRGACSARTSQQPLSGVHCSSASIPRPQLDGVEILDLTAEERLDQTVVSTRDDYAGTNVVSYCGVNITYTHTKWNDTIHVQTWLPLDAAWNGRFLGLGGGGWAAGYGASALAPAVADGFAAVATDAGHSTEGAFAPAEKWALKSPSNVDLPLLRDFASLALGEMTRIGQAVARSYYGKPPKYSYWNGCSTGGRQGLMMAQRYPELYDGILANAPAINWADFIVAEYWAQQVMNRLGVYPKQCELDAFTQAAISACDDLDGLEDGVIVNNDACDFDPHSVVGDTFLCDGSEEKFTSAGATVARAAWTGPINDRGEKLWYGLSHDASLSGLSNTTTTPNGTIGAPFQISKDWFQLFLAKDPNFAITEMTYADYFARLQQSQREYLGIIGTSDPDLSAFKAHGGKMITWHGTSDQLIFPNGTRDYYQRVTEKVPDVHDFYRFYEAPGVAHCRGGAGFQPEGDLEALFAWVENGTVPQTLRTVNGTAGGQSPESDNGDAILEREICAWPKMQKYQGGDPRLSSSFTCE